MNLPIKDLEKTINSALATSIKKSDVKLNQLFVEINCEDLISTIIDICLLFFFQRTQVMIMPKRVMLFMMRENSGLIGVLICVLTL